MSSGVVKYKRKVMLLATACILFISIVGVAWSLIFAAMQQTLDSRISVRYIAKQVAGTVSATYQVKNSEEKYMTDDDGNTFLVFDGSEKNSNGGNLTINEDSLELTSDNNSFVIKYSFTNSGDADYIAKISQNNTLENMIMEVSKDGDNYADINDYCMTVFNNTSDPTNYYVRFTIANIANDVTAEIDVTWELETIARDAVAIANGVAYNNFDDALDAVNNDSATAVAHNTASTNKLEYGIVSVIKDTETSGNVRLNKDILIYAEKNVTINHLSNSMLFDIEDGNELLLGFPYNKSTLTIKSEMTSTLLVGSGNLTINKTVLDNKSNSQGTAIDILGKVEFFGGKIINFNTGIYLNESTQIKMGGDFEQCAYAFGGSGSFVIDDDFELSNTTITNIEFIISKGNVVFNNVKFSGFTGSALDISSGNVSLFGCVVENCNDSAIKASGGAILNKKRND